MKIKIPSLKMRITTALIALVLIQGLILVCFIIFSGASSKNDTIAYNNISNQLFNRKNELQDAFNARRKNLTVTARELNQDITTIMQENATDLEGFTTDEALMEAVTEICLTSMVEYTKYNAVTGVFAVFDPTPDISDTTKATRTAVHIRDTSPGVIVGNNINLLLEYGRVDIARKLGITADYLWSQDMRFDDTYNRDFYYKPILAAMDGGDPAKPHTYGYWAVPFTPRRDDIQVITYSLPLMTSDGTPYGVLGFEMDIGNLRDLLPATEIPYKDGFYLLGVDTGDGLFNDRVVASGAYANRFLSGPSSSILFTPVYNGEKNTVSRIVNGNAPREKAIGAYDYLGLYDATSVFFNEKWTLVCIAPQATVMAGSAAVKNAITLSITVTILIALVLALMLVNYLFQPIRWLYERVRGINPEQPVRFERINVTEIDALSGALEVLSDKVSSTAARQFKIIELVSLPLGSYEINRGSGKITVSANLTRLLRQVIPGDAVSVGVSHVITQTEWDSFLGTLEQTYSGIDEDGIAETLFRTGRKWDAERWFRTRSISESDRVIGIILEVTEEMDQKHQLEFERDRDSLTRLYNRQAYFNKAFELAQSAPDSVGFMVFVDIDDLKFINDQFGHETGDEYIKVFAEFLHQFETQGGVAGRLSGDEFILFMTGFKIKADAKTAADRFFDKIHELSVVTPEGDRHRIRVSAGVAYYPDDSANIKELYKYADYAMYEAKHTAKGEQRAFNLFSYQKNFFVMNMKNVLDKFIEEKQMQFAFQPIVDAHTGEIYAFEALMRPMNNELKSPSDVLKVARLQSKLYQIEKLTFTVALNWLTENRTRLGGRKLFINSIPGVILSDIQHIFYVYRNLAESVIFEITENEFSDEVDTKRKVDMFRSYGAMVAIDDYGSGYSNELGLLLIEPDFLKIDMGFIRDIDKDTDKLHLVSNITAFARKKRIHTIAEGVETKEELETVIRLGVDYIQGYYLAKPKLDIADVEQELKNQVKSAYLYSLAQMRF